MNPPESTATRCPECHVVFRPGSTHAPLCSQATPTQKNSEICRLENALDARSAKEAAWKIRLKDLVTFYLGKFNTVRQENNALRRKVTKLPAPPIPITVLAVVNNPAGGFGYRWWSTSGIYESPLLDSVEKAKRWQTDPAFRREITLLYSNLGPCVFETHLGSPASQTPAP